MDDSSPPTQLHVIRGDATAEETAALIAVLAVSQAAAARAAAARGGGPRDSETLSGWHDRAGLLRPLPRHGPGAWRASGLPR
jgi:acyl-CoA carboxylase epsilon subunit